MQSRFPLYQQILLSMVCSVLFAYVYSSMGWNVGLIVKYLKPIGQLFIKSLKLLIVPLILSSLIYSVSSSEDMAKFSRIGIKTMGLYFLTTLFSVTLGVGLGIVMKPGRLFPKKTLESLGEKYGGEVVGVDSVGNGGMPDNLFAMFSDNRNLLHIVIFAMMCGMLLYRLQPKKRDRLVDLAESIRLLLMEIVHVIMRLAPFGVFGLVASELVITGQGDPTQIFMYLTSLLPYIGTVLGGLAFLGFLFYPLLVHLFTSVGFLSFIRTMYPAQLMAFSTSSSTAALRLTTERVASLGVERKVCEPLLSIGAVININGTALYQGIAIMFISQAFGKSLSLGEQIGVVLYVTIASIGEGGMPGGSLTGTAILLGILGIPEDRGLALIFLPDRILDMARSLVNITGDAFVTLVVASSEGKLRKKWRVKN